MAGGRKIKRKTSLYKKSRVNKKALGTFFFIVVVAILVALGYVIGSEWSKRSNENFNDNSSVPIDVTSINSSDDISSKTSSEQSSAPINSSDTGTYVAAFMPYSAYEGKTEAAVAAWVADAKANGYNTISVELKDETGIIHYDSKNAMALEYKAVSKTPADISMLVRVINEAGMNPHAVLSALKDKTAPNVSRGNAYAYDDQLDVNWWDNSAANGGKPWLNPYMQNTRTYIKDLCAEVADAGFKQVVLTNVMFPDKNTEKMNVITETMSRENILKKVVEEAINDKAFAVCGYNLLADDIDPSATINKILTSYEGSIPFIKGAEFDRLKPILLQNEIDDYVIY